MLAVKRLAGVVLDVDVRECKANKAELTLTLKPRGDTRNLKQGYQWPQKRTCIRVRQKHLKNVYI